MSWTRRSILGRGRERVALNAARADGGASSAWRGFEQFDEVAGGVGDQDLASAGADCDVAAERQPAWRSRSISASRLVTIRWMRLRPAPAKSSGVARAPELAVPDSSSRSGPRVTSAKAGAGLVRKVKPRWVV